MILSHLFQQYRFRSIPSILCDYVQDRSPTLGGLYNPCDLTWRLKQWFRSLELVGVEIMFVGEMETLR